MEKIYHLASCSTCQAIIRDNDLVNRKLQMQNIREQKITPSQLDEMRALSGTYESLFSRRALKYKQIFIGSEKKTLEALRAALKQHHR